jgi:hypothetical protein
VIINKFDPAGAYLGQYVANVIVMADPSQIDVALEVSYEDGVAYLEYGSPAAFPLLGEPGAARLAPPMIASADGNATFQKASFTTQGPYGPYQPAKRILQKPIVRWVSKCTNIYTAAGWIACGVGSLFTGLVTFTPCAATAMTLAFSSCTLVAIFGS